MTDHLAQLNIARMRAPLDDPIMSGFVDQLDHIESLQHYDYQSDHISPLRDRKEWFEPMDTPTLVLWWVPIGHIPTPTEARERLDALHHSGPTPEAFTFKNSFPPPT